MSIPQPARTTTLHASAPYREGPFGEPVHDGRLVADIVDEWAQLHGEQFELLLARPAGGTSSQGHGGEQVDALDFIHTLAGRLTGAGLMRHPLPL